MRAALLATAAGVVLDSNVAMDSGTPAPAAAGLRDAPGQQSLAEDAEWAQFGTVAMVLTYADSPRLPAMMKTWIPHCAEKGYDIALMLSEDAAGEGRARALIPPELQGRVQVLNTFATLGVKDYRKLERWKTWAYVRDLYKAETEATPLFDGRKHQWFMQLDDDTMVDCDRVRGYQAKWLTTEPLYLGAGTESFHFGWLVLLNRPGFSKLAGALGAQKLLEVEDQFDCAMEGGRYKGILTCCPVKDMMYADSMIGGCMAAAGVPMKNDAGFNSTGAWRHPLKEPEELLAAWNLLRRTGTLYGPHGSLEAQQRQDAEEDASLARQHDGALAAVQAAAPGVLAEVSPTSG